MTDIEIKVRKLSSKLVEVSYPNSEYASRIFFWCPACDGTHPFTIKSAKHPNGWDFNGDAEKATFHPSLRLGHTICHCWVQEGVINYEGDCPHEYKGKRGIPLGDFPEDYGIGGIAYKDIE